MEDCGYDPPPPSGDSLLTIRFPLTLLTPCTSCRRHAASVSNPSGRQSYLQGPDDGLDTRSRNAATSWDRCVSGSRVDEMFGAQETIVTKATLARDGWRWQVWESAIWALPVATSDIGGLFLEKYQLLCLFGPRWRECLSDGRL